AAIDWAGFNAGAAVRRIPLPAYPFERSRHWVDAVIAFPGPEASPPEDAAGGAVAAGTPRPDVSSDYAAPEGRIQVQLAAIWTELLGIERIGAHDSFFELGGHSLMATRMLA